MHLIRTPIDHGIETPEARKAKGKKEYGTYLSSVSEGHHVVVEVKDDGAGVTWQGTAEGIEKGSSTTTSSLMKRDHHFISHRDSAPRTL